MSPAEVLDRYANYLSEKDKKDIDSLVSSRYGIQQDAIGPDMKYGHEYLLRTQVDSRLEGSYSDSGIEDWLVEHVE